MLRRLPTKVRNRWWDWRLGVTTGGVVPIAHPDSVHYATMSYSRIRAILDHLDLGPGDFFVDVGSGRGRVLCCAARHPVERVAGVDLSGPLCDTARRNAQRLRGRLAPIEVDACLAQEFDYTGTSVLFLFDPFGATTLSAVLERVRVQAGPSLRVAYANPTHDSVFEQQCWLEPWDRWDATSGLEHAVSFYRRCQATPFAARPEDLGA